MNISKKIKNINLLKYFTIKNKNLSKKYIKECEKYIEWLGVDKKAFARGYTAKKFPKGGWEVL